MMNFNYNNVDQDENIAKMLQRSVNIFRNTGLYELADKWDSILSNYIRAKAQR